MGLRNHCYVDKSRNPVNASCVAEVYMLLELFKSVKNLSDSLHVKNKK